jgi:glycosyltransferase involved in cell wall biosynthesis
LAFVVFSWTSFFAAIRQQDIDLVIGTSPPIFQAATAWLVAAVRRVPFVLEVRDLWPEFAIDMGVLKSKALIAMARGLERFLYSHADHIIVNSPAYASYLEDHGVGSSKVTLVPNGVDPEKFDPSSGGEFLRAELGIERGIFIATYAGALGVANDIGTILQAAEAIKDRLDIKFLLVGDGKERRNLERQANELGIKNVVFLGARPKASMPAILAASDACLATLMDIPMFRTTYPNKVFDYMAAGRPTILGIGGVIKNVIEQSIGGIAVSPGDPAELASAVTFLADNREEAGRMGRSARAYVEAHFQRDEQAKLFGATLEMVLGRSS